MARQSPVLRIIALVPSERRSEIARQLAPLQADVLFVGHSAEMAAVDSDDDVFQVALLPVSLSGADWREHWDSLERLHPRPALLVYAPESSFQLWSAVLESGGFDVIVEPFSDEELQDAVLRAVKSFRMDLQ